MDVLPAFFRSISVFFSGDPTVLFAQVVLLVSAGLVVFLVLFAARDILMRSDSFWIQMICILLVAALPVIGFLLYLLLRPATTLTERHLKRDLEQVLRRLAETQAPKKPFLHQQEKQRKSSSSSKMIASTPPSRPSA